MKKKSRNVFICLFLFAMVIVNIACKKNMTLVAGGYTESNNNGIMVFDFKFKNGTPEILYQADAGPNPSFFSFSADNRIIYCINEVMEFNGRKGGGLTTLKFNSQSKKYEKVSELTVPYGGPCYISASSDGRYLFLANYGSASIAVVKTDDSGIPERVTDSLLYETDSTEISHPHMIGQDPQGRYVYVSDLGLDRIMIYDFNTSTGELQNTDNGIVNIPGGSGPRHFEFNGNGTVMYLINETGSTMMVFDVADNGGLSIKQTISTLSDDFQGRNYCADVHISPDGRFLYGSNRGENTISVFSTDSSEGTLNYAGKSSCGGDWPRNFVIDKTGKYLLVANQRSDQISVFAINKRTGIPAGPVSNVFMKTPACLKFFESD